MTSILTYYITNSIFNLCSFRSLHNVYERFQAVVTKHFPPTLLQKLFLLVRAMYFDSENANDLKRPKTKLTFRNYSTHLKCGIFQRRKLQISYLKLL